MQITTPVGYRFWSKVSFTPYCWEWTAFINGDGYGRFRIGSRTDGTRRSISAHRFAYEFCIGPIPDGLTIDHLCRNRACVNPDHLEVVTHTENVSRSENYGKGLRNRSKTHCPQGHAYDAANTHYHPMGWRRCRACDRLRKRKA